LKDIHDRAFRRLEQTVTVGGFASAVLDLLNWIVEKAPSAVRYPLEGDFLTPMAALLEDLASSSLAREAISASGFRLLLRHLIRQNRIPFRGTPLSGLQVLGFLETRCLNFRQVTVFDLNEGVLPPEIRPDPFLPTDLRKHLGLPDNRKTADISRYHLYRLLAGAEEVHLFFSEGGGKARSRFVEELVWEAEKEAGRRDVIPVRQPVGGTQPPRREPAPVAKSPEILEFLRGFAYSATAVDTYLWCPFRFYARYVLGLEEAGTAGGDEFDPVTVGITVHRILNEFYRPWVDRRIIFPEYCDKVLEDVADTCFREEFGSAEHWSGSLRLFREVLLYRINQFLRLERGYAEGRFLMGLEVACLVSLDVGSEVIVHGTLDRVEKDQDGTVWVLDYKTGGTVRLPQGVAGLTDRRLLRQVMPSLQLPIYLLMCDRRYGLGGDWSLMNAALYGLKGLLQSSTVKDLITPLFKAGNDRRDLVDRCYVPALKVLFREILDPAVPFAPDTSDPGYCASCPYGRGLCRAV
jgi:ATP-dependent helicase/nuclease subunit B